MPISLRYPFVRWAVMRTNGWGRPIKLFCDALREAREIDEGRT